MENRETLMNHAIAKGPFNAYAHYQRSVCSKMIPQGRDYDGETMTSLRPTSCLFCLAERSCR